MDSRVPNDPGRFCAAHSLVNWGIYFATGKMAILIEAASLGCVDIQATRPERAKLDSPGQSPGAPGRGTSISDALGIQAKRI